ncbi:dihydroxy-acid dehydratase [Escherichia coli]
MDGIVAAKPRSDSDVCGGWSDNMFDGALFLGVCDKIVPGLTMAALSFGHLPAVFVPSGPMASGLPNKEKVRIRQLYAEGKVDRMALLESEAASYHAPGTCTFYGTANTNQMVVEFMGMQLPGSSLFIRILRCAMLYCCRCASGYTHDR